MKWIIPFLFLLSALFNCDGNNGEKIYVGVVEGKEVTLPAVYGGIVKEVFCSQGDWVEKGERLAVLDTVDFSLLKDKIEFQLQEIENNQSIARRKIKRSENRLRFCETNYKRYKDLKKSETVSDLSYDEIETNLIDARLDKRINMDMLDGLDKKEKALLVEKSRLEKKIKDCLLDSPISGMIKEIFYEEEEGAVPMSPVVKIVDLSDVWVKIYIGGPQLPGIVPGDKVDVRVDGLDVSREGTIVWISPNAEFTPKSILTPETRTSLVYAVKIEIENQDRALKQGMPLEVVLK